MLLFLINIVLFGLFYANVLLLIGWPIWLCLLAALPLCLGRYYFAAYQERILSYYAQGSLLLGMAVIVIVVLRKLLTAQPLAGYFLLPLLVAVVGFYVLHLYLCWQRAQGSTNTDGSQLTFWVAGPSLLMSFSVSVVFTVYCLFTLDLWSAQFDWLAPIAVKFTGRGIIPPITLVFFCWALLILLSKQLLLSLGLRRFFNAGKFDVDLGKAGIGRKDYIEQLWQRSSESYLIPKYLNWSIPILGFIGTVLGISLAADGIQGVIVSQQGLSQLSNDLGEAIAPLGIAFDTTLIALSLSIMLTLLQILQQRFEDRVLNKLTQQLSGDH